MNKRIKIEIRILLLWAMGLSLHIAWNIDSPEWNRIKLFWLFSHLSKREGGRKDLF